MSFKRVFSLIRKGARISPDNPILIFVFFAPFLYTVLVQSVFGALWKQKPVVAVFEQEGESISSYLEENEAVQLIRVDSEKELRNAIEDKKADVGVAFPKSVDEILKSKETVKLSAYVNGDSHARARIISIITVLDGLRKISPYSPQISFEQISIGKEKGLNIGQMIIPLLIFIAVMIASFMLAASYIIQEKEKKTLSALLVTPMSLGEVLMAFGAYSTFLAILMGFLTLFLNAGLDQPILHLLAPLALGSIFLVELGLIAGIVMKDMNTLMANIKLFGIFLYAPGIIIMFPNWPQWIAKIFPTYYIMNPILQISIYGESLSKNLTDIMILLVFIVIIFFPLMSLTRRFKESV